jgi:RNA polymerase sigma-70 factor (ECF subfamily)
MDDALPILIRAWRDRADQTAARRIVDALYPLVARIVRRHATGCDGPEDLAQEVFTRLFETLDRYDDRLPLENWVARLALNVCRNRWTHRARRPAVRWEDLPAGERAACEAARASAQPLPDASAGDARAFLVRLLETLPADDRLVLSLLHLEGKSVEAIAGLLGWSRVRVKVRAFRARARLRKIAASVELKKTAIARNRPDRPL